MPRFLYRALDPAGVECDGELTANSRTEAYRLLKDRGLRPSAVDDPDASSRPAPDAKKLSAARGLRLSQQDLLFFTEELAELIEAGLQLESALRVIGSRGEDHP